MNIELERIDWRRYGGTVPEGHRRFLWCGCPVMLQTPAGFSARAVLDLTLTLKEDTNAFQKSEPVQPAAIEGLIRAYAERFRVWWASQEQFFLAFSWNKSGWPGIWMFECQRGDPRNGAAATISLDPNGSKAAEAAMAAIEPPADAWTFNIMSIDRVIDIERDKNWLKKNIAMLTAEQLEQTAVEYSRFEELVVVRSIGKWIEAFEEEERLSPLRWEKSIEMPSYQLAIKQVRGMVSFRWTLKEEYRGRSQFRILRRRGECVPESPYDEGNGDLVFASDQPEGSYTDNDLTGHYYYTVYVEYSELVGFFEKKLVKKKRDAERWKIYASEGDPERLPALERRLQELLERRAQLMVEEVRGRSRSPASYVERIKTEGEEARCAREEIERLYDRKIKSLASRGELSSEERAREESSLVEARQKALNEFDKQYGR